MEKIQLLFRGYSKDGWVYGLPVHFQHRWHIITDEGLGTPIEIKPGTITQYSGMEIEQAALSLAMDKANNTISAVKNKLKLFTGDKTAIQLADLTVVEYELKFGINRRNIGMDYTCDIASFYFQKIGDSEAAGLYPICHNWQGKHDLDIMFYRGNIWNL